MNGLELKLSPRVSKEGNGVFGKGAIYLLKGVQETGSLRRAASLMEMSYKKAIKILKRAEEGLGQSLLERTIGGKGGGGSQLTAFGETFLQAFLALEEDIIVCGKQLFEERMKGIL